MSSMLYIVLKCCHYAECNYDECHAECRILSVVILRGFRQNVVMMSVVAPSKRFLIPIVLPGFKSIIEGKNSFSILLNF
jgi:hypothetical protein